jgi:hypothetical protein
MSDSAAFVREQITTDGEVPRAATMILSVSRQLERPSIPEKRHVPSPILSLLSAKRAIASLAGHILLVIVPLSKTFQEVSGSFRCALIAP